MPTDQNHDHVIPGVPIFRNVQAGKENGGRHYGKPHSRRALKNGEQ